MMMRKKSIYLETSVISYLTSLPPKDLVKAARQKHTMSWWITKRHDFELFISQSVMTEISEGDPQAAAKRLDFIKGIPMVELLPESVDLADFLVRQVPFPGKAEIDALHIAIACVNEFDIILTWNFKHIANASLQIRLTSLVESKGFRLPTICTPEILLI
jgi:hypothetical protein